MAAAMRVGAEKYQPYNWRSPDRKVQVVTYLDAALRHIFAFLDGEECSNDTNPPVSHLGHAMASLAVVMDAIEGGFSVDDRPTAGKFASVLETMNTQLKTKEAK